VLKKNCENHKIITCNKRQFWKTPRKSKKKCI